MKELYTELLERLEYLESQNYNDINKDKIIELNLVIVRVQQILLSTLTKNQNISEEIEIPKPTGDFIINNATGKIGNDGMYYHFSDVCKLLKLYKNTK